MLCLTTVLGSWLGPIQLTCVNCRHVVTSLLRLNAAAPKEPITLIVNSGGGAITEGFAIYDTMKLIEAPVHTVCNGQLAIHPISRSVALISLPDGLHSTGSSHTPLRLVGPSNIQLFARVNFECFAH